MEVIVNNKATVISESATLEQLISELNILSTGMAMAVNKQLIPRTQWKTFSLTEKGISPKNRLRFFLIMHITLIA